MTYTGWSAAVIDKKTTILCTIKLAFLPQTFQPSHDPVLALQPIKWFISSITFSSIMTTNHSIARSLWKLCAFCRNTLWNISPGSIVTNSCEVCCQLELGETLYCNRLIVSCVMLISEKVLIQRESKPIEDPLARSDTNPWEICGTIHGAKRCALLFCIILRILTIAPGNRMTPSSISLTYCPVWWTWECHPFLTSRKCWSEPFYLCFTNLKVTTACNVVLLPSNHPFGKIPGDPQLISRQLVIKMTIIYPNISPLHTGWRPVQTLFLSHRRTVSPMIM